MFSVSDLSLSYSDAKSGSKRDRARGPVFSGLNLEIAAGETVALIGESGVGKTTLLSHLRSLKPKQVAWCPQDPGLVPALSGFHNIYAGTLDQHSFFYSLRQLIKPSSLEWQKVAAVAEPLGIADQLSRSLDQLSGGQQQRVNIARALIQKKSIFLADEPVSALDEFQRPQVLKHIAAHAQTCVFVLHDLDLALECCDRIIGLGDSGVVVDSAACDIDAQHLAQLFRHHQSHAVNSQ
tara:strand:+ start:1111 stop:1821 length:711 start_codon:yes stop_codon:yes gene_type:complete